MPDEEQPKIALSPKRGLPPEVVVSRLEAILKDRGTISPSHWYAPLRDYLPPIIQRRLAPKQIEPALRIGDIQPWFEPYQDPHEVLRLGEEIRTKGLRLDDIAAAYVSAQMQRAIQASEELSYLDNLTRLANRRRLMDRLERNILEYSAGDVTSTLRRHDRTRKHRYLSIIVVDIDDFKKNVNDKLGYREGDKAIQWVANRLRMVRQSDLPARWGGEEFVIECPDMSRSSVRKVAERIRKDIEENSKKELSYRLTISVGTATYNLDANDARSLLQAGFQAAYVAKKAEGGKNRVVPMSRKVLQDYHKLLALYKESKGKIVI